MVKLELRPLTKTSKYMTSLEKLSELFEKFPGIGPRQARRFVHHLLTERPENVKTLSEIIASIQIR